jgi:hypothetical protein
MKITIKKLKRMRQRFEKKTRVLAVRIFKRLKKQNKKFKKALSAGYAKSLAAAVLVFGLIFQMSLGAIIPTNSLFYDLATITDATFQANTLDMSLNPADFGEVALAESFALEVKQDGSLPFQYRLEVITDDNEFCQQLTLTASSSAELYTGQLKDFQGATTTISALSDNWQFKISDPGHTPSGQTCNFNFVFQAWQIGQENYNPLSGFSDTETVSGRVLSGSGQGGAECVQVTYPNGGEVWWVGRTHEMKWTTQAPDGHDSDLKIDLYYSNNSGQSWGLITQNAANINSYFWRVPLFLEGGSYWVPSDKARIKVVARFANGEICGWDMSDEDFCPPIDYGLITPEEAAWLAQAGMLEDLAPNPITAAPNGGSGAFTSVPETSAEIPAEQEEILTPTSTEEFNFTPAETPVQEEPLPEESLPAADQICYEKEAMPAEQKIELILPEALIQEPIVSEPETPAPPAEEN